MTGKQEVREYVRRLFNCCDVILEDEAGEYARKIYAFLDAIPVTVLRDGIPFAEFADASYARMFLVMVQSNEAATGNAVHTWTLEGAE